MTLTRLFIIHPEPEWLHQAATLLHTHSHLRVSHVMASVHECLARVSATNCDLILVSATLPDDDVRKLLKQVRQQAIPAKAPIRVIVTDVPNDPKAILSYIAAGAAGYVLAQEGVGAWVNQVEAVGSGQPLVSPAMAAAMMEHLTRLNKLATGFAPHAQRHKNLTQREHEVLLLLGEGHPNQAIAERLIIAVGTVKNHVHNVLTKLNLSNRKAAGMYLSFVR
jgi:DNA-binding NarL/FixJ family response regulator